MQVYYTLKWKKEEFRPIDPDHVRLYVGGPTVYDLAHIGNARPAVVLDVLVRLLRQQFPRVTYVTNITDIDDKIIAKHHESGESVESITVRTTQAYLDDIAGPRHRRLHRPAPGQQRHLRGPAPGP